MRIGRDHLRNVSLENSIRDGINATGALRNVGFRQFLPPSPSRAPGVAAKDVEVRRKAQGLQWAIPTQAYLPRAKTAFHE
ncbi:MAG: hypothetical protein DMG40_10565 [Acidobacteria bacterium]|nr:MAG: hypothetical protein DMG40_10565 [Acidobacteriota bacterium]